MTAFATSEDTDQPTYWHSLIGHCLPEDGLDPWLTKCPKKTDQTTWEAQAGKSLLGTQEIF